MSIAELVSTDPCTGEAIWTGPVGGVAAAVARARAAAPGWARRPLAERIAVVRAFKAAVEADAAAFAQMIARETGKPLWETRTEVASVAAKVEISITAQAERAGEKAAEAAGVRQMLRHKPHGVLAVLGPYNFPAHLPNGHIVPALLAGNVVVFKPSEQTPAVADFMAGLWAKAGLPEGVLNLVHGGGDVGRDLAGEEIDGLLFTGSAHVGAALARQFAETPHLILALEMGGNNPLVAWDLTDIDAAAATVVQSAFLSAGQRCTNARRLIVGPGSDALVEAVLALTDRLIVGAPFGDPQPFMGPVIANAAADGLERGWAQLQAAGGHVLRPLVRARADRPILSPAVIDMTDHAPSDDELFGPVLQIVRVSDWDAAIAAANATRFGLAAGLIGGDAARFDDFWARSRAGIVNWNRPTNGASSAAPFGGIGASGNHRPSAYYAADYCAFPVATLAADALGGGITSGLRP
ncbi:succinylglutamate-semialdehyde dehydrogenase [Sandarakinorhabdus limnophila]|jgi:succinylglutamic semialdehyde dehydrogenase|uniref:succinylglutamate-semialdehyde dehydrogenase n=1 Tax=Sandarakinorhabdus limnophila TaxID=210512 RepID=UPI0026F1735F|nr:succinylglutamate-semialdehyde dehydrogenase [Sandarakinorhabdus limnophila]